MSSSERETILVVDDQPGNIDRLADILGGEYRVTFATNGPDALLAARTTPRPRLILLDIMMPEMDGREVCRRLKADLRTRDIPIIFLTACADTDDEALGLKLGAVDYLRAPCHPAIVRQRVRIHLDLYDQHLTLEDEVRERTRELEQTRIEIVRGLGRAAEYRDNETGLHVIRMSTYCRRLALAAGIPAAQADLLELAAQMHDIGKIGVRDHVLLKAGPFDAAEAAQMQAHVLIGAEIIGHHHSALLTLARTIALTHHERWDGRGYPQGLCADAIPVEGRIAALCDAYDEMLKDRPGSKGCTPQEAAAAIVGEAGKAFDPQLVALFTGLAPEFEQIGNSHAESP